MQRVADLPTKPCRYCQKPVKWLRGQTAERPEPHWILLEPSGTTHRCAVFARLRELKT